MDVISMTTIILLFSCIHFQMDAVHWALSITLSSCAVQVKRYDTKNMSILWFNFKNSNAEDIMRLIHSTFLAYQLS